VPVAATYGLQLSAAAIFVPLQTEKYYDLTGAIGHLTSAAVSLLGPSIYNHLKAGGALASYRLPPLEVSRTLVPITSTYMIHHRHLLLDNWRSH
jgi:hypothetical protein